jgi:hypothetical protein
LTGHTKTEKESESVITMCNRMQMYNIIHEKAKVYSGPKSLFYAFQLVSQCEKLQSYESDLMQVLEIIGHEMIGW